MIHSNQKIIKHKVGLLNLAEELGNVSKACKMMGVSRDIFYRYQEVPHTRGQVLPFALSHPHECQKVRPYSPLTLLAQLATDPHASDLPHTCGGCWQPMSGKGCLQPGLFSVAPGDPWKKAGC
jgi:hypothetical protein